MCARESILLKRPVDVRSGNVNKPTVVQIRVRGHLDAEWSDWFDGFTIVNEPGGDTVMTGPVRDQAALNGLLTKVFDLNLELISVAPISP